MGWFLTGRLRGGVIHDWQAGRWGGSLTGRLRGGVVPHW